MNFTLINKLIIYKSERRTVSKLSEICLCGNIWNVASKFLFTKKKKEKNNLIYLVKQNSNSLRHFYHGRTWWNLLCWKCKPRLFLVNILSIKVWKRFKEQKFQTCCDNHSNSRDNNLPSIGSHVLLVSVCFVSCSYLQQGTRLLRVPENYFRVKKNWKKVKQKIFNPLN